MTGRRAVCFLCTSLAAAAGCQGPPPVGRAASPTPTAPQGMSESEEKEILGKIDAAKAELKKRPGDYDTLMRLARLYYQEEQFLEAARHFRLALDAKATDVDAAKMLGVCLFMLGNPDDAVRMQELVLKQVPGDLDALFFIGAILVNSKQQDMDALKRAEQSWSRFLELSPNHPRAAELRGQLETLRGAIRGEVTLGGAEKSRAAPADDKPAAGAGMPGPERKKGMRAAALKAGAKPLDRKRAEALDAEDEGRFYDARLAAEDVLAATPDDDEMGVARARALVQLGEGDNAIKAFGEIIKRNPKYSPAWHYLGMAYMMGGDGHRAAQTWLDLAKMDPAYATEHRLQQRAAMAEQMARQQQGQP